MIQDPFQLFKINCMHRDIIIYPNIDTIVSSVMTYSATDKPMQHACFDLFINLAQFFCDT